MNVELDLCVTFAELAKSEVQAAHAEDLKSRAEQGIKAVKHFVVRVEDSSAKAALERRAVELKRFISASGSETEPRP